MNTTTTHSLIGGREAWLQNQKLRAVRRHLISSRQVRMLGIRLVSAVPREDDGSSLAQDREGKLWRLA